jgi:OmpA-OmpF porin, OOP family
VGETPGDTTGSGSGVVKNAGADTVAGITGASSSSAMRSQRLNASPVPERDQKEQIMKQMFLRNTAIATLALAPFITGCATKKFVRTTVTPIQQKVSDLDATTQAHGKSIEELDRGVARADERAMGADALAQAAGKEAGLARKEAADGRTLAEQGLTRADQLGKDINSMDTRVSARFENMQNYKQIGNDQVLFGFNQSELSKDAMATLDNAASKLGTAKGFVVEVQGFTDSTGNKTYNLELSRKRAEAVVRYLTIKHSVPLHRIFVAGFGEELVASDAKQSRRVELKIFQPLALAPMQVSSAGVN